MLELRNTRFEKMPATNTEWTVPADIDTSGCGDSKLVQFVKNIRPLITRRPLSPYGSTPYLPYIYAEKAVANRDIASLNELLSKLDVRSLNGYSSISEVDESRYSRFGVNIGVYVGTKGAIDLSTLCFGFAGVANEGIQHITVGRLPLDRDGLTEAGDLMETCSAVFRSFEIAASSVASMSSDVKARGEIA